jgi:hypothetical protein
MIFQRINWENWRRMLHVPVKILWVSPLVDFFMFAGIALACAIFSRILPNWPMMRVAFF